MAGKAPRSRPQARLSTQRHHSKSRKFVSHLSTAFLWARVTRRGALPRAPPTEQDSTAPGTDLGSGIQAPDCPRVLSRVQLAPLTPLLDRWSHVACPLRQGAGAARQPALHPPGRPGAGVPESLDSGGRRPGEQEMLQQPHTGPRGKDRGWNRLRDEESPAGHARDGACARAAAGCGPALCPLARRPARVGVWVEGGTSAARACPERAPS